MARWLEESRDVISIEDLSMNSIFQERYLKMGMTENQKLLIRAVSANDLAKARQCAIACLAEDNTQKNKTFVNTYKKVFSNEPKFTEVPLNIRGKLIVEDVQETFLPNRYYVSDREKNLFNHIERMQAVSEKLMEKRIPYINATMLYGESGTGKTTFGKYVAYRLGLPFCYLNFSNIVDSLLGKTSTNIASIFNYVKSFPCVLMLDEVDCIALVRGKAGDGGADGEMSRITITLMQEFDNLPNSIVVLGATNRVDKIDPAFLRRFPQKHEVEPFSQEEARLMIDTFLEDVEMNNLIPESRKEEIVNAEAVQGKIMYSLIREIGKVLYREQIKMF